MVDIMAMDRSHHPGGTGIFSLVPSIEFGGHALIEIWARCLFLSQSAVAQEVWAARMAPYILKEM